MNLFRWQAVLGLAMVLAIAADVHGQRKVDPHISYVYPGGGKQGTTIEVVAGGQFLKEVDEVYVSGGGVRVTVGKYFKHLSEQEYRGLRMRASFYTRERLAEEAKKKGLQPKRYTLEELIKLTNYTDEQLEQMEDYRKRDDPKRQFNPQLLEDVTLKIQIDPDAALGDREIRLITPSGMSNPMFFQVSNLAEVRETEPNDKTPDPVVGDKLPAVINGQIMPGDVDRFAFKARKGTRLVAAASVRALVPYLADAVPGWFQAVLAIYDSNGNELAYADSLGFRQDPVIYYEIPKDGEYVVQIWDSIYRGREDFVYRIAMGELPFITSVFPLGGRAGTKLNVELTGWNLPVQQVPMNAFYDRRRPIRSISVRQGELVSNRIDFPVDMLTETVEKEPNNKQDTAQEVPIPVIMNGRIDKPGDIDVFKFEGHASEHFIAEVFARRLGSPMDSLVRLTDANGREVAFNDDYKDEGTPLITHHADSRLSATLPTSGTYHLHVIDAQRRGGPENGYRLYMRQPRPDFELRVVPSTIITRPGSCVPIIVYALRRDGFTGEIQLELEEAPPGFALTTSVLPANQDKVWLTLMVAEGNQGAGHPGSGRARGAPRRAQALPPGGPCRRLDAGLRLPPPGAHQGMDGLGQREGRVPSPGAGPERHHQTLPRRNGPRGPVRGGQGQRGGHPPGIERTAGRHPHPEAVVRQLGHHRHPQCRKDGQAGDRRQPDLQRLPRVHPVDLRRKAAACPTQPDLRRAGRAV